MAIAATNPASKPAEIAFPRGISLGEVMQ